MTGFVCLEARGSILYAAGYYVDANVALLVYYSIISVLICMLLVH